MYEDIIFMTSDEDRILESLLNAKHVDTKELMDYLKSWEHYDNPIVDRNVLCRGDVVVIRGVYRLYYNKELGYAGLLRDCSTSAR